MPITVKTISGNFYDPVIGSLSGTATLSIVDQANPKVPIVSSVSDGTNKHVISGSKSVTITNGTFATALQLPPCSALGDGSPRYLFEFTPTGQPATIKSLWNVADSPDTQYVGDISTPLED